MVFVLCLICLYFLLDRSGNLTQREPESVRLARHMNDGPPTYPYTFVKSSVDWGQIPHRYLTPRDLIQLPTRCHVSPLPRVQHRFKPESREVRRARDARRRAVRELTRKCWESYREYAWKQDALMPLSATGRDQFSGWAATLVDSLDTLWIMGFREEFDEAVAAVAAIDFGVSTTSDQVNIFETNIRYLGGLLAAYDLSGREVLLQKAIELGNLIYAGFNTENRMPVDNINLTAAKEGTGLFVEDQVVSASPGTLTMELAHLSQLTGDPKYYDAINRVVDLFFRNQNRTALPGLFPQYVSMSREDVTTGASFTLGGGADSLYEYFPKMYALLGGLESKYATLTLGFMDAAKRHLFFRPMVPDNADILMSGNVFIDKEGSPRLDPEIEHLACFAGATFALAGRLLGNEENVDIGARLARGCAYAYRAFPMSIMPERLNMVACEPGRPCRWDEEKWRIEKEKRPEYKPHLPKGFTSVKDPRYILRPEAIESVFYMWRITGDPEWEQTAWEMFLAVANGTATQLGSASVKDVTVARSQVQHDDYMESFWIAETLKYFYLVFSPPDVISLDEYVLNTEAHPFRLPGVSQEAATRAPWYPTA